MARPQRDLDPDSLIGHFGQELRTYRNNAALSQNQLAEALGCTGQWIGAVELSEKAPSEPFAIDLDTYFTTNGSFHRLWKSIKRADQRVAVPQWFKPWAEIEQQAGTLKNWEPLVVPGLLQTPDYARAMLLGKPGITEEDLEKLVAARMDRQQILAREVPALLWAVVDEGVLRRLVGNAGIMHAQLGRLIEMASLKHVTLQVVPLDMAGTTGLSGPFWIATTDSDTTVAYIDGATEGRVTENSREVAEVVNRYDAIRADALPSRASIDLISKVMKDRWTQT